MGKGGRQDIAAGTFTVNRESAKTGRQHTVRDEFAFVASGTKKYVTFK